MARVHLRGVRYRAREAALLGIIQQYTGQSPAELRKLVDDVVGGTPVSVHVEDVESAYELANELVALGIDAEPDESDF